MVEEKLLELTLSQLSKVDAVHPGDFAVGAEGVEDHHNAHRASRPDKESRRVSVQTELQSSSAAAAASPVWTAWNGQTQAALVGVLDLLFLQTDEPLQSAAPVLRHCAVQVLTRRGRQRDRC